MILKKAVLYKLNISKSQNKLSPLTIDRKLLADVELATSETGLEEHV